MNSNTQGFSNPPDEAPALVRCIGKTTYYVRVHFSQTSHETIQDKIKRMLINDVKEAL